jgi:hypothetical protein
MRAKPPPEKQEAGGPGESYAGIQSDIKENDHLGGGIDGAEGNAANRRRQAESRLDPHLAHIGNHWRVWNARGWLVGVYPTKSAACAAILRERWP